MDILPDERLVERIRAGDKDLYEVLMLRYRERLYRVARAIVRDSQEAADIVQEAFVRAYTHLDQFAGTARFSTWLTKIAVHEALARWRHRTQMTDSEITSKTGDRQLIESMASQAPGPEQQVLAGQALQILEAAVDALPFELRSVFMMREIEEMSTAETAACLGISEEAVKIRLYRARRLLRRDLHSRVGAVSSQAFRFLGASCSRVVAAVLEDIQSQKPGNGK